MQIIKIKSAFGRNTNKKEETLGGESLHGSIQIFDY